MDASSSNRHPFNVITGKEAGTVNPSMNFRIYWDGDLYDELLDGTNIAEWSVTGMTSLGIYANSASQKSFTDFGMTPSSCNSTKSTPCLQADIFGDWREEVIWWNYNDPSQLYIVSTATTTKYRVPTLMHDHLYRMGIAWQNCAYNQPPHLGYYLPDYADSFMGVADEGTGVEDVNAGAPVVSRTYYNMQGQCIARPPEAAQVYIVKEHHADGSVKTKKRILQYQR